MLKITTTFASKILLNSWVCSYKNRDCEISHFYFVCIKSGLFLAVSIEWLQRQLPIRRRRRNDYSTNSIQKQPLETEISHLKSASKRRKNGKITILYFHKNAYFRQPTFIGLVLRLRRNAHWQKCASFDSLRFRAGLGHLGKGWIVRDITTRKFLC